MGWFRRDGDSAERARLLQRLRGELAELGDQYQEERRRNEALAVALSRAIAVRDKALLAQAAAEKTAMELGEQLQVAEDRNTRVRAVLSDDNANLAPSQLVVRALRVLEGGADG